jgi:hypothetical protein
MATNASASDDQVRKAIECYPAEGIIELFGKFDKLKPEKRDTVDAFMDARFKILDGGKLPDRFFYRHDQTEIPFTLSDDGRVTDFNTIRTRDKNGEVCAEDQARAGLPESGDNLAFNADLQIRFHNASGTHSLAELQDGTKDGKSFFKKLVPAPVRLMIPKFDHVTIEYEDRDTAPNITAFDDQRDLSDLIIQPFGKTYVISVEHLEEIGADRLVINGGPYSLEPSPSIKKMKQLGFTESDDEDETPDKNE